MHFSASTSYVTLFEPPDNGLRIGIIAPVLPGAIAELRTNFPDAHIFIIELDVDWRMQPLCDHYSLGFSTEVHGVPPEIVVPIEKYEYLRLDYQEPATPLESLQRNHKRYKKGGKRRW